MSNPARKLYDIFYEWQQFQNNSAVTFTQITKIGADEGVETILLVSRLLNQIDDLLESIPQRTGDDLSMYRNHFGDWVRISLGYGLGWQHATVSSSFVNQTSLDMLNGLALYFAGKVYVLPASAYQKLPELLQTAKQLVVEDHSLNAELKAYLLQLISETESAFRNEKIGASFDFESAIMRLATAFQAAGLDIEDDDQKNRFFDTAKSFIQAAAINASALALTNGGDAAVRAILPGGN